MLGETLGPLLVLISAGIGVFIVVALISISIEWLFYRKFKDKLPHDDENNIVTRFIIMGICISIVVELTSHFFGYFPIDIIGPAGISAGFYLGLFLLYFLIFGVHYNDQ